MKKKYAFTVQTFLRNNSIIISIMQKSCHLMGESNSKGDIGHQKKMQYYERKNNYYNKENGQR